MVRRKIPDPRGLPLAMPPRLPPSDRPGKPILRPWKNGPVNVAWKFHSLAAASGDERLGADRGRAVKLALLATEQAFNTTAE